MAFSGGISGGGKPPAGTGGGVTDHAALTGLNNDDHSAVYYNKTLINATFATIANLATTTGIANGAQTAADNAQTTANTAVTNAGTAQTTANLALSNAATAQSTADGATSQNGTQQISIDDLLRRVAALETTPTNPPAVIDDVTVVTSIAELNVLKTAVQSATGDTFEMYSDMISRSTSATAAPVSDINSVPNGGIFKDDMRKVLRCAIRGWVEGNDLYYNNAAAIFAAWAPSVITWNADVALYIGWGLQHSNIAANILQYVSANASDLGSSFHWDGEQDWLDFIAIQCLKNVPIPTGTSTGSGMSEWNGANHITTYFEARAGAAILLERRTVQEVQSITVPGTVTTYTLQFGASTTANIAQNASAATIQSALQGLSTIGTNNARVSGSAGGPYTVTFTSDLAGTNVGQLVAATTGGTGTVTVATVTTGGGTPSLDPKAVLDGVIADVRKGIRCWVYLNGDLDPARPATLTAGVSMPYMWTYQSGLANTDELIARNWKWGRAAGDPTYGAAYFSGMATEQARDFGHNNMGIQGHIGACRIFARKGVDVLGDAVNEGELRTRAWIETHCGYSRETLAASWAQGGGNAGNYSNLDTAGSPPFTPLGGHQYGDTPGFITNRMGTWKGPVSNSTPESTYLSIPSSDWNGNSNDIGYDAYAYEFITKRGYLMRQLRKLTPLLRGATSRTSTHVAGSAKMIENNGQWHSGVLFGALATFTPTYLDDEFERSAGPGTWGGTWEPPTVIAGVGGTTNVNDFSVDNTTGTARILTGASNGSRRMILNNQTTSSADSDVYFNIQLSSLPVGGNLLFHHAARIGGTLGITTFQGYLFRLKIWPSGEVDLGIYRCDTGDNAITQLSGAGFGSGANDGAATLTTNTRLFVRCQAKGPNFKMKAWLGRECLEPQLWQCQGADSTYTSAARNGFYMYAGGTSATTVSVDDYYVYGPV